jgi:hypothetical protein
MLIPAAPVILGPQALRLGGGAGQTGGETSRLRAGPAPQRALEILVAPKPRQDAKRVLCQRQHAVQRKPGNDRGDQRPKQALGWRQIALSHALPSRIARAPRRCRRVSHITSGGMISHCISGLSPVPNGGTSGIASE